MIHGSPMRALVCGCVAFAAMVATAGAQHAGFQGGVSFGPDQVYVGSHFESAPLVDRLHFRPGIEGGFGSGVRLAAINFEFVYRFPLNGTPWSLYQGTGPAVNILRIAGETDVAGGLNAIFGVGHRSGFFAEFKVGAIDSPNLKLGVGWTVR